MVYTKVRRAEQEERTRTALLDAASDAFYDGTWENVALATLAARAGVTKQTLLRHFGSRDGLLEQALRRGYETVRAQRLAAPTDDIDGAVDNLIEHYDAYGARALIISRLEGRPPVPDLGRVSRRLHYEWVEHAFGTWLQAFAADERARVRAALIVACDVHTWNILARDLALPPAEVRATLIMTIRRILGAQP